MVVFFQNLRLRVLGLMGEELERRTKQNKLTLPTPIFPYTGPDSFSNKTSMTKSIRFSSS